MPPSRNRATFVGMLAIPIWATLPLLTTFTRRIPPLEAMAISFVVATLIACFKWIYRRENPLPFLAQPLLLWALGIYGFFGYHFLYFLAYRHAPPAEVALISALWPLLIVLFSSFFPGESLRVRHVIGAFLGIAGAGLLVTGGATLSFRWEYRFGYLSALACALIWSSYSVLSRRFKSSPTDIVGGFCALTAVFAFAGHLYLEPFVAPTLLEGLILIAMGLGPLGISFFFWDLGMKHGKMKAIANTAYFGVLLSTSLLVVFRFAQFTQTLLLAAVLIFAGSLIASETRVATT